MAKKGVKFCVGADGGGSCLEAVFEAGLPVSVVYTNNPGCKAIEERTKPRGVPAVDELSPKDFKSRREHEIALMEFLDEYDFGAIVMLGDERVKTAGFVRHYMEKGIPIFNTHPAPLPQFRGLNGYAWAIGQHPDAVRRNEWTAVSFHRIDDQVDRGNIIAQTPEPIYDGDNVDHVMERGKNIEYIQIVQCLRYFSEGRIVFPDGEGLADVLEENSTVPLSTHVHSIRQTLGDLDGKVTVEVDSLDRIWKVRTQRVEYNRNVDANIPINLLFTYAYDIVKQARQAGREVDFVFDKMNIHPIIMKSDLEKGEKPY